MPDIKTAVNNPEYVVELEAITSMKSEQTQLAQKETALKQVLTYLLVTLPNPEQCTIIQHLQAEQKHVAA